MSIATDDKGPYVSRGGLKLRHALDVFAVDPAGWTAADLGCSTGGFTDCLLKAGVAKVYAVDTAYGELAWTLRNDPRVVVMERTNALHAPPPTPAPADLVVADMSWTPQRLVVPAAARWLKPGGRLITLVKPHYELKDSGSGDVPAGGVLDDATAESVARQTAERVAGMGWSVLGLSRSPILGGGRGRGRAGKGNAEWLLIATLKSA